MDRSRSLPRASRWVLPLTVLACSSSAGLSAPRDFTVRAPLFDQLEVSWTPSGAVDGYDLEARSGTEPWERLASGMPRDTIGATIPLRPETPELLQLSFRVRATSGGATSAWAEATFLRGVRSPTNVTSAVAKAQDGVTNVPPVTVTWTNQSSVATALELERAPVTSDPAAVFAPLAAAFPAQTFRDEDPLEATAQTYRVRYGVGGIWSDWAQTMLGETIELLPARDITVTPLTAGGVKVAWRPRSHRANLQRVYRWSFGSGIHDGGTGATDLPPDASEYVDPIASYFPVLRYQVETVRTAYFPRTVRSDVAMVQPFTLRGPPAVAASGPLMPSGESFARDEAGRIHVATQGLGLEGKVLRANAAGWDDLPLDDFEGNQGPPRLAVDGLDLVHALYVREIPGADPRARSLTHAWDDGTSWRREEVPLAPPDYGTPGYWLAAGTDGSVHVAVLRFPTGEQLRLETAHRDASGWTHDVVPASGLGFLASASFAAAPDGTAYELVVGEELGASFECRLRVRAPGAGWGSEELVPGCTASGAWLLAASGGRAAVLYGVAGAELGSVDLHLARRLAGGGFAADDLVVHHPHSGASLQLVAASSADGTRATVLLPILDSTGTFEEDQLLLPRVNGAGWDAIVLGPGTARSWAVGFDAAGKAWALGSFSFLDPGLVPYALYQEP